MRSAGAVCLRASTGGRISSRGEPHWSTARAGSQSLWPASSLSVDTSPIAPSPFLKSPNGSRLAPTDSGSARLPELRARPAQGHGPPQRYLRFGDIERPRRPAHLRFWRFAPHFWRDSELPLLSHLPFFGPSPDSKALQDHWGSTSGRVLRVGAQRPDRDRCSEPHRPVSNASRGRPDVRSAPSP